MFSRRCRTKSVHDGGRAAVALAVRCGHLPLSAAAIAPEGEETRIWEKENGRTADGRMLDILL